MNIQQIKQQIWGAASQDLSRVEAAIKFCGPKKDTEEYWQRVLHRVQTYKPKRKPPPKPKLTPEQIKRYRDAKYAYEQQEYIHWIADGHFIEPEIPNTATGNGLTEFIVKYLNWSGHFANRTSNEGRVIIDKDGKPKRIPSSSKNGMQDIDCNLQHPNHPFGIPWKIEVKANRDTIKKHQIEFGEQVKKTGAVYSVVRSVEDFFSQYDRLINFEQPA